jgi:hypothetical protein
MLCLNQSNMLLLLLSAAAAAAAAALLAGSCGDGGLLHGVVQPWQWAGVVVKPRP